VPKTDSKDAHEGARLEPGIPTTIPETPCDNIVCLTLPSLAAILLVIVNGTWRQHGRGLAISGRLFGKSIKANVPHRAKDAPGHDLQVADGLADHHCEKARPVTLHLALCGLQSA
jgi:hypothetical protein